MASPRDTMGKIANIAQLFGVDAFRLTVMFVKAASTIRLHKKTCREFAEDLDLIRNLLKRPNIPELKRHPETRKRLEQLEDALTRSYALVNSCKDQSYFYLLAMGWYNVYQLNEAQNEIYRYLGLLFLNTSVQVRPTFPELNNLDSEEAYSYSSSATAEEFVSQPIISPISLGSDDVNPAVTATPAIHQVVSEFDAVAEPRTEHALKEIKIEKDT